MFPMLNLETFLVYYKIWTQGTSPQPLLIIPNTPQKLFISHFRCWTVTQCALEILSLL